MARRRARWKLVKEKKVLQMNVVRIAAMDPMRRMKRWVRMQRDQKKLLKGCLYLYWTATTLSTPGCEVVLSPNQPLPPVWRNSATSVVSLGRQDGHRIHRASAATVK